MNLTFKNLLINLAYYLMTLVVGPYVLLKLESALGLRRQPLPGLWHASFPMAGAGVALQVWCIVLLQIEGRGTPSPALPPSRLVVRGPYRWVRNPLNIGELLVFLALSAGFGSLALLAYTLLAWLLFHVFVVAWEEPRHKKQFGAQFLRYAQAVNRWIPTLRRTLNDRSRDDRANKALD